MTAGEGCAFLLFAFALPLQNINPLGLERAISFTLRYSCEEEAHLEALTEPSVGQKAADKKSQASRQKVNTD